MTEIVTILLLGNKYQAAARSLSRDTPTVSLASVSRPPGEHLGQTFATRDRFRGIVLLPGGKIGVPRRTRDDAFRERPLRRRNGGEARVDCEPVEIIARCKRLARGCELIQAKCVPDRKNGPGGNGDGACASFETRTMSSAWESGSRAAMRFARLAEPLRLKPRFLLLQPRPRLLRQDGAMFPIRKSTPS